MSSPKDWNVITTVQEGEMLSLKGFLFQDSHGQWILSKEPNLKSCCIGSSHKIGSQLILSGDFSQQQINVPLQVSGILFFSEDRRGLANVTVCEAKHGFPYWTCALVSLFCILALVIKSRRGRLPLP